YVRAAGVLRIGASLTVTQQLPGEAQEVISPSILDWVPEDQIHWRLSQKSGLVQRMRYMEIEKLTEEAVIFSNGEDWSGMMAGFVPVERRKAMRAAFEAMSEALKAESVKLWQARAGAPTSAPE